MGMFDKLKKQAEKAVDEHGDKIAQGIDKAADMADAKTKGERSGQIDKGAAAAKDALDKLDGKDDDIPDGKPPRP
jgi:antitoxin protein of toxin-antitoxin system